MCNINGYLITFGNKRKKIRKKSVQRARKEMKYSAHVNFKADFTVCHVSQENYHVYPLFFKLLVINLLVHFANASQNKMPMIILSLHA